MTSREYTTYLETTPNDSFARAFLSIHPSCDLKIQIYQLLTREMLDFSEINQFKTSNQR